MNRQDEIFPWQHSEWKRLCQYIEQRRIPQALLITGLQGLGKQQLARRFAFSLLCQKPQVHYHSCGHCPSCLLLAAETHPDYLLVQPEEAGKNISINQIRSLIVRLTLKPQFESYRVVIIKPADQMNNAAANAFLKCLEEPAERTAIILITDKPAKLPATIISRCQKLVITRPDKESLNSWLEQHNIRENPDLLYGLSQGAPLLALSYAGEEIMAQRQQCFKDWMAVAKQQNHPVIIAEGWLKVPEEGLLFWLTSWIIDLIKCCYQTPAEKLYNPDLYEALKELSQQLDLRKTYKLYDLLLATRQRLATPINRQSMFEEILIHWFELNQSK